MKIIGRKSWDRNIRKISKLKCKAHFYVTIPNFNFFFSSRDVKDSGSNDIMLIDKDRILKEKEEEVFILI